MKTNLAVGLGPRLYQVERPWQHLPAGFIWGQVSAVTVDSQGRVYVCQRLGVPVVVFDQDGEFLTAWGQGVISDPHGIAVGPNDEVIVVDRDAHQVVIFSTDGEVRQRLGTEHRPALQAPFNAPTDAAIAPDGEIYVADGYGNSCVHRFAADGSLIRTWGRPGHGPAEFITPHAVWIDRQSRVLVADRENDRVQLFDREGTYIGEWDDFYRPMDIYEDKAGLIYVTDQIPRLTALTPEGEMVGRCRPVLHTPHGIWGRSDDAIYLAEFGESTDRVTKLTPVAS